MTNAQYIPHQVVKAHLAFCGSKQAQFSDLTRMKVELHEEAEYVGTVSTDGHGLLCLDIYGSKDEFGAAPFEATVDLAHLKPYTKCKGLSPLPFDEDARFPDFRGVIPEWRELEQSAPPLGLSPILWDKVNKALKALGSGVEALRVQAPSDKHDPIRIDFTAYPKWHDNRIRGTMVIMPMRLPKEE